MQNGRRLQGCGFRVATVERASGVSVEMRREYRVAAWCVRAETREREWAAGRLVSGRVLLAFDETQKLCFGVW